MTTIQTECGPITVTTLDDLDDLLELAYLAYLLVDSGMEDGGRPRISACKPLVKKVRDMLDNGFDFDGLEQI